MKALVVEDTATSQAVICHLLERMGIQPIQARDGSKGIALFEQERPDLILLDIILPGIDGFEVARRIRGMEKPGQWTPIIFLTALTKDEDLERGIEAGGDDYLSKPVSEVVLGAKVRAMQRIIQMRYSLLVLTSKLDSTNRELTRLSAVDGLTGIANRRQFDEALAREWRRCLRAGEPLSLLMCDVDFFKQYNDGYGHQAGDECLKRVAETLRSKLRRPADIVARYGGEEFAAILPDTNMEGAMLVAEAMRAGVQALAQPHENTSAGVVTVSLGVAALVPQRMDGMSGLVSAADWALYEAKRRGAQRSTGGQSGTFRELDLAEAVFPFPQGGEDLDRLAQPGLGMAFGRGDDSGLLAPQEGIGCEFHVEGEGDARQVAGTQLTDLGSAGCQGRVARFHGKREADVGQRVFMGAVHERVPRQGGEPGQRRPHLLRRALEQAAATAAKQRVAAEQRAAPVIGDMPACVTGHLDHPECRGAAR